MSANDPHPCPTPPATEPPPHVEPAFASPTRDRVRRGLSLAMLTTALGLLAATFFLISPPQSAPYPGAIPWQAGSLLRRLVEAMSLGGTLETARGVEVKDVAFHAAAALGLMLLAARAAVSGFRPAGRAAIGGAWLAAQVFLGAWVALSLASTGWSSDPSLSLGQSALYALALAWAVALAWTLEGRDVPRLLGGYVAVAALGAAVAVWYWYERNPHHRATFPIGNPTTLAACILPALMIAACALLGAVHAAMADLAAGATSPAAARGGARAGLQRLPWLRIAGCGAALIALVWCLALTRSRAALVALAGAAAAAVFVHAGRRLRVALLLGSAGALVAGVLYFSLFAADELTMARGATIRFRLYAWRYAAELWAHRAISGHGAGTFAQLVNPLSLGERLLDPGAFMAENIEHAHNELFEVLAEIGLVGGVTFVAGYVAAFAAAIGLFGANLSIERRWLLTGLAGGWAGLVADALLGVGLRLSAVPAVFYTLLGTVWAAARSTSRTATILRDPAQPPPRPALAPRLAVALASAGGFAAAGWLTLRNADGLAAERAYEVALRDEDFEGAEALARRAEARLLEPFRKLVAARFAVEATYGGARRDFDAWLAAVRAPGKGPAAPDDEAVERQRAAASRAVQRAFLAADALERRAPAFARSAVVRARCAERLAWIEAPPEAVRAADWTRVLGGRWAPVAWRAWKARNLQQPYEVETLLALTRYPATPLDRAILLRDALRAGFPPGEWSDALRVAAATPAFDAALEQLERACGPYDPQTAADVLILSFAPETYRLGAYRRAQAGQFAEAAEHAARAAALYRPMRSRFPALVSVAAAEQADFALRADPADAPRTLELLDAAIRELPVIQEQKFQEQALPFRRRRAMHLLAAGREDQAAVELFQAYSDAAPVPQALADLYVELVRGLAGRDPAHRGLLERWASAAQRLQPRHLEAWSWRAWLAAERGDEAGLEAALRGAAEAGVGVDGLVRIRAHVAGSFPDAAQRWLR